MRGVQGSGYRLRHRGLSHFYFALVVLEASTWALAAVGRASRAAHSLPSSHSATTEQGGTACRVRVLRALEGFLRRTIVFTRFVGFTGNPVGFRAYPKTLETGHARRFPPP